MPAAEVGDFRVYYEEHGSGDPILLVAGLGADHTAWTPHAGYLQDFYRVVVFDNPGVGQTTGPPGPYTTALFADVAAGLAGQLGIERAHIAGASMGGLVVQQVAVRHPDLIRSLLVHCPWWRPDHHTRAMIRSWQAYARAAGMLELLRQIWLWVFTPRFFEEQADVLADLERQAADDPHAQSVDAFCDQAEACLTHEPLEAVRDIRAPTLITVGDTDILTPPAHARALHERIAGSILHVWPEMGHAPFWEIPDEFNRRSHDFLSAQ